jgi:hypothetical protein
MFNRLLSSVKTMCIINYIIMEKYLMGIVKINMLPICLLHFPTMVVELFTALVQMLTRIVDL